MIKLFTQRGSTILELLVAVSIFLVLVLVTATALMNVLRGSNQDVLALSNIDQARLVTSQFTNEIRNAVVGADGSYQIKTASDNQIIFYSKSAFNGSTINRINYYLVGNILYKGVIVPSGNPLTYNVANESKVIVQRDVTNAGVIFNYYDDNYDGTTNSLTQPVNINSIKFVRMTLVVLNQTKDQSTANFTVSAGATIRNLKTNLGN